MLECVINLSEGRDDAILARLAGTAGRHLLDCHRDADHHRSVFTLIGQDAARAVTEAALHHLDLRMHQGVHPRLGVVDVVPFVPLGRSAMADALTARDEFAQWLAVRHQVPCFFYGPERTLPDVRRHAFGDLRPDLGPDRPHPRFGATAVGARDVLVAYNLWLARSDIALARRLAASLRGPSVRALGLDVGGHAQVSMNLVNPLEVGPTNVYDRVAATAEVARAELVGLLPDAVRRGIDPERWEQLGIAGDITIEARLETNGLGRA